MSSKFKVFPMVLSAMFLALALVFPFITGQIPQIGAALCPMHIPVLLCAFICGPYYAVVIGLLAPYLRFALFGLPPIMPSGIGMSIELATYGLVAGVLYAWLPKKKVNVYVSLIVAMIAGRVMWGISRVVLLGVFRSEFSWDLFISGAVINAIPGIILQIVAIPILVMVLPNRFGE